MKALAFLVRDEGHAKCKQEQNLVLDSIHEREVRGIRTEAGFPERFGDPFLARDRALRNIPLPPAGDDRNKPLEEIAARSDQLCLELSATSRIEREREAWRHLEIPLHGLGGLDPDERIAVRHDGPEIGERLDDERP